MFRVSAIPIAEVPNYWPLVKHFFEILVARNPETMSIEVLEERLVEGDYILIILTEGSEIKLALTADVVNTDSGKRILEFPHFCGTDMDKWLPVLMDNMADLAKDFECWAVRTVHSRLGMGKTLKQYGGKVTSVTVEFNVAECFDKVKDISRRQINQ